MKSLRKGAHTRIVLENTNAASAIQTITGLPTAQNQSNSSYLHRISTLYGLYRSTSFPSLHSSIWISMLSSTTLPQYASQIPYCWHYRNTTHSFSVFVYSPCMGHISTTLSGASVSWLVLILWFGIYRPTYAHWFRESHLRAFRSASYHSKTSRRLVIGPSCSCRTKIPIYLVTLMPCSQHNGGLRCIHHLSHPWGTSVNDFISKEASHLRYVSISKIIQLILQAGHHCMIIKENINDAFRNIPVAPHVQWLLDFSWGRNLYEIA